MWTDTKIDCVAPPFAGHLFPLLALASSLRNAGLQAVRVLSTSDVAESIRLSGAEPIDLLPGRAAEVWAIANTSGRTGFHPLRLYRQFRANMQLMVDVAAQLERAWTASRPDIVIADFTVPVAGLVARRLGIRWWTSMPSPCALESRGGPPSYLGGWSPRHGSLGRLRDAAGRATIRTFKLGVARLFRRELRAIGFDGVYRADGSEAAYSDERILALGMRELEFDRDWPDSLRFVGPLIAAPPFEHVAPQFREGRATILVTLGTHLPWARRRAVELIDAVAAAMPDCDFHFAAGQPGATSREARGNVTHHGFIPYDQYIARYDAAIVHGGTGITYACIGAGLPMLVWPHDYDQFDHAARIIGRGLGLRLRPDRASVVASLRRLLSDAAIRSRAREFQALARRYDAARAVIEEPMNDLWTLLRSYAGARWRFRHLHGQALAAFQDRRARAMVAHAIRRSPFYRGHFDGHDTNDWRALPPTGKQSMMQSFDAFNTAGVRFTEAMDLALRAEAEPGFPTTIGGLTVGLSSGTSGRRGLFVVDRAEQLRWAGTMLARALPSLRRRGLRLAFFLRSNSNLYRRLSAWIDFRYFDLTTPLADSIAALNVLQPDLLAAPPSMLARLAEARDRGALRITPERLVSVAEVLEPQDEERLRASFGVPVHQVYQCTEGLVAVSCAQGSLHLQEDVMAVQFERVSEHDATRVTPIVTDLWRRTQPILRYRLGDVMTLAPKACACGSSFRAIERIEGRLDDVCYLQHHDGTLRPLFPDDLRRLVLDAHPSIEDYQLTHSPASLRIHVQSSGPFDEVAIAIRATFAALPLVLPSIEIHHHLEPANPLEKRRRVKCGAAVRLSKT